MPVREFHGELDPPAKDTMTVRMPDGTLVRNVPVGTTKAELARRVGKARPFTGELDKPKVKPFTGKLDEETSAADAFYRQRGLAPGHPLFASFNTPEQEAEMIPKIGGVVGAMAVPGAGWGALALQSLGAFAGAGGGELLRQKITGEEIDPGKAIKTGATEGAGNLVGGGVLKGLGGVAHHIFSSGPLPELGKQARQFAAQQDAPFPLGLTQPSGLQRLTGRMLGGRVANQQQAIKLAQSLNQSVGAFTSKARPIDEAAVRGQAFLRKVFEPGETALRNTFAHYRGVVGDQTPIPTRNTLDAALQATERLANRGQTTGGLYQRLRTMLKRNPDALTTEEFDELYGAIIKQSFSSTARAGGEGRLMLEAITRDLDEFGKPKGIAFGEEMAMAQKMRDQFRNLRNIPGLERLAADFGKGGAAGTRNWMNELFANPNGKALAEFRKLNPDLYTELADSWLAGNIDRFSQRSMDGLGRYLDGAAFRQWFDKSRKGLETIYGPEQVTALNNFSAYAAFMSSGVGKVGSKLSPADMLFSGGAGMTALGAGQPGLIIPAEAAAWLLARGVTDPRSHLFRIFTEGFSPATRASMLRLGQVGGQSTAREASE